MFFWLMAIQRCELFQIATPLFLTRFLSYTGHYLKRWPRDIRLTFIIDMNDINNKEKRLYFRYIVSRGFSLTLRFPEGFDINHPNAEAANLAELLMAAVRRVRELYKYEMRTVYIPKGYEYSDEVLETLNKARMFAYSANLVVNDSSKDQKIKVLNNFLPHALSKKLTIFSYHHSYMHSMRQEMSTIMAEARKYGYLSVTVDQIIPSEDISGHGPPSINALKAKL